MTLAEAEGLPSISTMRDTDTIPGALNPALLGSHHADNVTETPASQFEFSINFSPQTASFSGSRSPWSMPAAYTPLQLSHDGTSDNSRRLHSRLTFETGLADNNTSLESSSRHTPQHTPQSTGQSLDCQKSIPAFDSRDYNSLFLGLSEAQQTGDETSLDGVEREQVKQVRKQGACLRCRIYKEKVRTWSQTFCPVIDFTQCDLEIPCGKCCEVLATAKILKQPCEKLSLQEVIAFRGGNSRAGQIRSTFPKMRWSFDDRQIYTIQIRQDFINPMCEALPTMPVTCRRFLPTPADVLIEPYEAPDGEVLIVTSPPMRN